MFVDKNSKDLLEIFFKTQRKFSQGVDVSDEIEIKRIIAVGIMSNIILSKKIFKKNVEIGDFLMAFMDISFSKWMLSSRTLICGKTIKYIKTIDSEDDINNVLNSLYSLLKKINQDEDIHQKDIYEVIRDMEI